MGLTRAFRTAALWLVVLQRTLADAVHDSSLNVTWPLAHHSWVVVSDGFKNATAEAQFQRESISGHFCRRKQLPDGAERVEFPIRDGGLQFQGTTTHTFAQDGWKTIHVVFDNFQGLRNNNTSVIGRSRSHWKWDSHKMKDGLCCSNELRPFQDVVLSSDDSRNGTEYSVPQDVRNGLEATLAIEMIRYDPRPENSTTVLTVTRQCTLVRFTWPDMIQNPGPCAVLYSGTPAPSDNIETTPPSSDNGNGFAAWETILIVLGVTSVAAISTIWFQWRKRKGKETRNAARPTYDAAERRLERTKEMVPAPDYVTANGGIALPSYEEATKK